MLRFDPLDTAVRTWSKGVPMAPMAVFADAGFPSWLDGLSAGHSAGDDPRADRARLR